MAKSHFSLTWDKFHSSMCDGFSVLQQNEEFVDLTLAADGHLVKVHQIVIGSASPYLKELILSADRKHPIIFLNNVSHKTLCSILQYVYTGQVLVEEEEFSTFFQTAKTLQIKGLEEMHTIDDNNQQNDSVAEVPLGTIPDKQYQIDILGNKTTKVKEEEPSSNSVSKLNLFPTSSRADGKKKVEIPDANEDPFKETMETEDDNLSQDFDSGHIGASDDDTQYIVAKDDDSVPKPDLSFTVSNKGSLQLILNRYMYNLHSRKPGRIKRWGCVDNRQKNCPAVVFTENNIVIRRLKLHNHPFHDKKISAKIMRKAVYSAFKAAENSLSLAQVNKQ